MHDQQGDDNDVDKCIDRMFINHVSTHDNLDQGASNYHGMAAKGPRKGKTAVENSKMILTSLSYRKRSVQHASVEQDLIPCKRATDWAKSSMSATIPGEQCGDSNGTCQA